MRIAQIITRADDIGGAQVHVRDLSEGLIARGHEVTVLAGGAGAFSKDLEARGIPQRRIPHLAVPVSPVNDGLALIEILRELWRIRPDIVATHTAKAGLLGRLAAATLGYPAVFTPHGWSISDRISKRQGKLFRCIEQGAAAISSRIINVCAYEAALAEACNVAAAPKLAVVHNGIADIPSRLRADASAEPARLVMLARMSEPKDHFTLLEALGRLTPLRWELDLVGDGPLRQHIENEAAQLGIAGRIRFLGFRNDTAELLRDAQVCVLSSRSEAFPYSILEAMRAGLPVVASGVGGVPEAVVDGQTGLLVPTGDPAAMAEALARVIAQPALRKQFGDQGRRRFLARFSFEQMFARTLDIYNEVAGAETAGNYKCRRAKVTIRLGTSC
jgi:glycosyltransferase involved in cell wall biosynthesis